MATLMAALGREDETDCTGYLTNVDWSRGGGHPRSYMEREVSAARCAGTPCPSLRPFLNFAIRPAPAISLDHIPCSSERLAGIWMHCRAVIMPANNVLADSHTS